MQIGLECADQPSETITIESTCTLGSSIDALADDLQQYYPNVYLYFGLMGQLWPSDKWSTPLKYLQYLWTTIVRLYVCCALVEGFWVFAFAIELRNMVKAFVGLSIVLQSIVLVPSIPVMSKRLNAKYSTLDLLHYRSGIWFSLFIFGFSFGTGLILVQLLSILTDSTGTLRGILLSGTCIQQLAISCLLSLNALFVWVDIQVSLQLVESLTKAHVDRSLTITMFNDSRDNIATRVKSNYWAYNSVLFIALLNILLMIILLYVHGTNSGIHETYGTAIIVLLKEIPFVVLVLYYATFVNEKADNLSILLGGTIWTTQDLEEDRTRMFLFTNAESRKISFPLAGMRLKKKDLLVRAGSSLLAFAFGLLKVALEPASS